MLGTQTRGGRMVGADEFTELWRHPKLVSLNRKPRISTQLSTQFKSETKCIGRNRSFPSSQGFIHCTLVKLLW